MSAALAEWEYAQGCHTKVSDQLKLLNLRPVFWIPSLAVATAPYRKSVDERSSLSARKNWFWKAVADVARLLLIASRISVIA